MPQGRGSTAARASFANGRNLREVGLHQCPSERNGEGVPVRSLRVPSHVPSHPQTAAKVRGFSPIASGFTAETDWLLERDGFELLVPLAKTREGDQRAGAREKRHPFFIRNLRLVFLALHQRDHLTAEPAIPLRGPIGSGA
jgi:hypothetical protein